MPYLFVDYDQGAGGEFFCHSLSSENGCVSLTAQSTERGPYKVFDSFDQEFIKKYPEVSYKKASDDLYEIVPSHRNTYIAKDIGLDFRSIRIKFPTTGDLVDYVSFQRVNKVLLAPLPSIKQFFGELETLLRASKNKEWIRKVSIDMDNLSLILLAHGKDPTPENKQHYLEKLLQDHRVEPNFDYDLIIEYENLIYDTDLIKQQIQKNFGIEIQGDWLSQYKRNYDAYIAKT
jgi:hypothetical protein